MDQLRLIGDTTLLKPSKEEYEVVLNLKQMLTGSLENLVYSKKRLIYR